MTDSFSSASRDKSYSRNDKNNFGLAKEAKAKFDQEYASLKSLLSLVKQEEKLPHFPGLTQDHWELAKELLEGQPDGTKLGRMGKGISQPGSPYC